MSRPLALRLTVGTALVAVVASAAGPAFAAATDETQVSYVVADGTRQFKVTEVDGVTPLADFTFGSDLQKPFRTVVNDVNRPLLSDGYQVNATMTNLYLKKTAGSGHDYTNVIPSKNLSLSYGATPLAGTSTLPVIPRVGLSGIIGTCADADVAAALGITALTDPLGSLTDPAFVALSPLLKSVCTELGRLSETARTVDVTVDGAVEMVTSALSLSNLPFTLSGGEAGQFVNPSYTGSIASADPAKTATAPTAKRVMTGNPLGLTGDLSLLLSSLSATLAGQVPAVPIAGDNSGMTTLQDALGAIGSENGPLVSTISRLPVQDQLDMLLLLTNSLLPVDLTALTTVTGQYDGYPVLQAREYSAKQGTYDGTLVVDFFETGS